MTDTLPEASARAGAVLKAAREEMSLSLEQVADELHLRPSVVKAMEDENFDEFPNDVFLKGYFKTYCRVVNLHESRMMALLDQELIARKKQVEEKLLHERKVVQSKKHKKLLITLFVFIFCLSLVALVYHFATQTSQEADARGSDSSHSLPVSDDSTKLADESAASADSFVDGLDESSANNSIELDESASYHISDKENTPPSVDKIKIKEELSSIQMEQAETNTAPATTEIKNAPDPNNQNVDSNTLNNDGMNSSIEIVSDPRKVLSENADKVNSGLSSLTATFSGDCWFKLTDSEGKTRVAALKRAGDIININRRAPFHIVIGDAAVVSILFEGEQVNLAPYTASNGRAELTLRPTETESEG